VRKKKTVLPRKKKKKIGFKEAEEDVSARKKKTGEARQKFYQGIEEEDQGERKFGADISAFFCEKQKIGALMKL